MTDPRPEPSIRRPDVRVSRKGEERLRRGHPWVFGDDLREVPEGMAPGQWVRVLSRSGEFLGTATANLSCRLALRRVSRADVAPTRAFFESRLRDALERRAWAGLVGEHALRLVHSEGDFLPGLIVDRYGGVPGGIPTAGMEIAREEISTLGTAPPRLRTFGRAGGASRSRREGTVRGGGPPTEEVENDGVRFLVDVEAGPKTGFFLDQRENRRIVRRLAAGKEVLDGFCAAGGFGLYALAGGARGVLALDSSKSAVATAAGNAARNGCADRWRGEEADLFQALRDLSASGRRFDLVVLDPPSFTKSREGRDGAIRGYRDINRLGLSVLAPGGLLATSSCTQLVDVAKWMEALRDAASDAGADLSLVAWGGQPPDHPVLLSVPETGYLKFAVYRKLTQ
jgi:23S rRNA (cytosine1962-C5)-methyltransferase